MSNDPSRLKSPIVTRRLPPGSFLQGVRPLQTIRYFCFVICHSASLLLSVVLLYAVAYLLLAGGNDAQSNRTRPLATFGLSIGSGAFGAWLRKLARDEERNIAEQQDRELQMDRFNAEEDQRRKDNDSFAHLLTMLDALPVKGREKIISDCLGRLQQSKQRWSKTAAKAATA